MVSPKKTKSKPVNASIKPFDPDERVDALASIAMVMVGVVAAVFWLSGF
jgi:hypothetical protein